MKMQADLLNKMAFYRSTYRLRRTERRLGDPETVLRRWRECYSLLHHLTSVGSYLPR